MYPFHFCQTLKFELDNEPKSHSIGEKHSPSLLVLSGDGRDIIGMSGGSTQPRSSKAKDGLAEYKENLRMLENIHKLELQRLSNLYKRRTKLENQV